MNRRYGRSHRRHSRRPHWCVRYIRHPHRRLRVRVATINVWLAILGAVWYLVSTGQLAGVIAVLFQ